MYFRILLVTVFVVVLLNFCKVEAGPIISKASAHKTSQTADINTKRDVTPSPPSGSGGMDAGTIMQQLLKDYEARQGKNDNPMVETPTAPEAPAADSQATCVKDRTAEVTTSLDALEEAVKQDDSIYDEIKKNDLPSIKQLLQQLQEGNSSKNSKASTETFSKLLDVVATMANKVVEQNDDGKLRTLLSTLSASLHKLAGCFPFGNQPTAANPTSGKSHTKGNGASPDLSGVDSAIAGQQEA